MTITGHISQIARTVENLDRARQFWCDTLGRPELYTFPCLAFFDLDGTRLMLRETGQSGPADILYLSVDGMDTTVEALTDKGVRFTQTPHMIHRHPDGTTEWMAFFKDDEGRDLALHAVVKPPAA